MGISSDHKQPSSLIKPIQRSNLFRLSDAKYLNTTGFLSYHESEILTLTLLKLKALGVVAYGVHDCVIVKQSDKAVAVETYRDIIRNYCLKHQRSNNFPSLGINVAITIEEKHTDKVKLEGSYV